MLTFSMWGWVRERVICRDVQFGAECRKDWFKLGGEALFDFLHWGMHVCIDGDNIGTELFHFLLGLGEIRLQGIEASFQVLATGVGNDDEETKMGWEG